MSSNFKLPNELIMHILEYNPAHREKMYFVFKDIRNIEYCEVCNKIIIKYVYSKRGCDMICCSHECVDNYSFRYYGI
jgi:hypothetical protein